MEKTQDRNYIISLIQDEGQELYDILEIAEEAGEEIDSPWFEIAVKEEAYKKDKIRVTMDFSRDDICPTLDSALWEFYKKIYLRG